MIGAAGLAVLGVHVGNRNSRSHPARLGLDPDGWWLSLPPSCREGSGPLAMFYQELHTSLQPQGSSTAPFGQQVLKLAKMPRVVSEARSIGSDSQRHN